MTTPIADFIENYIKNDMSRLHMPGHKGTLYSEDITEVKGADALYEADGIIAKSEQNATKIFGTKQTLYSTEGSSQCIKAMLMLALNNRENKSERPLVLAARNVHKAFISAAALIDFDVKWLMPKTTDSLCKCIISKEQLKETLENSAKKPNAVYITSPDYLGNIADIRGLSEVCKEFDIPLLVDNAHGAYLKFLGNHPIDLGADMCCDSAHKTLPVLTGGAYLHINNENYLQNAKEFLSIFGSTSPSYLILSSLDKANKYMAESFTDDLNKTIEKLKELLVYITNQSDEEIKLTIDAKDYSLSGFELAEFLRKNKIECEYSDEKFLVLMVSPFNSENDFLRLKNALKTLKKAPKTLKNGSKSAEIDSFFAQTEQKISIREAYFSPQKEIAIEQSEGEICGIVTVSCPPAIPIALAGEKITQNHIKLFKKYGIKTIKVVAK
ncbi:MAG: PLP-dependent transferase [Clostridia bacterium]|nr:PLP-dependent transferase [Clostridia bacterium]